MERSYFDWNAGAPLRDDARTAVAEALGLVGNPSSIHSEGRTVRRLVERARELVARLAGAESRNVIFTSGATEANALALTPGVEVGGKETLHDKLFVSAVEHPSVRRGGRFAAEDLQELPVDKDGVLDLSALRQALS